MTIFHRSRQASKVHGCLNEMFSLILWILKYHTD